MGLSTNTTVYTGGAQTFAVNFALGFLSRADVQVRVNAAVDGSGDPVYTSFSWIDDSAISVIPTLTIGDTVEVLRTVSKTSLAANFAANTDVTPANLDISAKQGLMVYQELIDGRVDGTESPIVAGNRAEAAALASEAAALASEASRVQTGLDAAATAADRAAVEGITSNVLFESELTSVVSVKALNQGVATTDSPSFVDGTFTGDVTIGDDLFLTGPSPAITLTDNDIADEYTKLLCSGGGTYLDSRDGASNGPIIFRGQGGGVATQYGRFSAGGNFGIGDTSPAEKLSVTGNISVTGTVDGRDVATDGTKLDGIEAGAKADQVGLVKGDVIGAGVDLDTYTTDGYFHQNISAHAGSGTNYPVAFAGMLSVQASGSMVYQKYQTYNGGGAYQRTKYNTTWYAWDKILDTGNAVAFNDADKVILDALDAQYDAARVVYRVAPAVPSRVGDPTWFPATLSPYLNTIISADGPDASDNIWRSVLIGDSIASEVTAMSQAVAVGNGAMRFSGTSDATTAVGSLSLQWLGLALEVGEDNSDAMVRTRHDFVTADRLDDVSWDAFGLETSLPGTRAKLNAVVIPTVASSLEGNTAVGRNSGLHLVKGYDNTLMGRNALAHGFDSTENVAIGNRALRNGALANQNVAVGTAAGQSFIEGSDNIFIGDHAGFYATTGSNNLMLGSWAGDGFTGAVSNNLFIGMGTGATPIVSGSFSNGRVGINVDYADHLGSGLHVRSGTTATGAIPNTASDALVIEESGASTGISILTDNTQVGQINFADPEDNNDGYLRYDHSTREMSLGAANAERLTIDSSGHTIIPAGVTLGTAAGTYAAANTLDDYEEGTFTPVFTAGGTSTATYDTQIGTYTKVGNLVTVNITLKANAIGTMVGPLFVTGLPFTSDGFGSVSVGYGVNLAVTAGTAVTGYVTSNQITMREWDAVGGTSSLTPANLSATAYMIMSATYKTTA